MKKSWKKFLKATCFSALAFLGGAGIFTAFSTQSVQAERTQTADADKLVVPTSYKQYLALTAPQDVAVNEAYTAIADGNVIYLYDELMETYRTYTHDKHGADSSKNVITQVQFDQKGNLYFSDDYTSDNLYVLNPQTLDAPTRIDDVACRAFALYGEDLYFTNSQGTLYYTALDDVAGAQDVVTNVSAFCLQGEELYAVRSEFYLHKFHAPTQKIPDSEVQSSSLATLYGSVKCLQVTGETLAYTTVAGDFYAHPIASTALPPEEITRDNGGYENLNAFGGFVYAVKNQSVRQFNPESKSFTDFEICASSNQDNRLHGASDICFTQDTLYIADKENNRISALDRNTRVLKKAFDTHLSPTFVSSDGQMLLTANEQSVALYSLSEADYGALVATFDAFSAPIKGVVASYGKYYIACEGFVYTVFQNAETGEWLCDGNEKTAFFPELFTSDVYGNLYTLQNGAIFRFNENDFLSPNENGARLCLCPLQNVKKLAIDYKKQVYALSNSLVYKLGEENFTTDFSVPLVYANTANAQSFAFGVEENETYLLFDGNYLVQSSRLQLPTVKTVAVENADERIFSTESAQFEVVQTAENALFVRFDLQNLQGEPFFPYLSYERKTQAVTALKMDETSEYHILAVFDESTHKYDTYLVLKEFCHPLNAEDYRKPYEEPRTGYLTNALSLYKFPYLCPLLTTGDLPRGGEIQLLGEIGELDHEYYHISYTDGTGREITGYIPQSYVTPFNGAPLPTQETTVGENESDASSVGRLVYLLLGFSVICILTDYLLLRKKKDE
ncbi:MAG: hypothetical protein E7381_03050 [Clostridiales bacterium]|nr:hypothetical protein [Clostridiales bacterium]